MLALDQKKVLGPLCLFILISKLIFPLLAQTQTLDIVVLPAHNLLTSGEKRLTEKLIAEIQKEHIKLTSEFSRIFEHTLSSKISLVLQRKELLKDTVQTRARIQAAYIGGKIYIPFSARSPTRLSKIFSALRHEYIHLYVGDLSKNSAPAWLDEGLAQFLEGAPPVTFGESLYNHLQANPPLALNQISIGLTEMEHDRARVAYAQSLFSVRFLINKHGMSSIRKLLKDLGRGNELERAFNSVCGIGINQFEERVFSELAKWKESGNMKL